MSQLILQPFRRFTHVTTHFPTLPSLYQRHSSFYNTSVALPTSQIILQLFHCFTYVRAHSPTLLSLLLRHLASRPWHIGTNNLAKFVLRLMERKMCSLVKCARNTIILTFLTSRSMITGKPNQPRAIPLTNTTKPVSPVQRIKFLCFISRTESDWRPDLRVQHHLPESASTNYTYYRMSSINYCHLLFPCSHIAIVLRDTRTEFWCLHIDCKNFMTLFF